MASKILDVPGEQAMCYYHAGIVRIWRDFDARDTEDAIHRYSHPYYRKNQKFPSRENTLCLLGGI
jgi:hypothetical protein